MAPLPIFFPFLLLLLAPVHAGKPHHITFRSPDFYPAAVVWDPSADHFLVGSHRRGSILSVSDAGVVDTLITDPDLPGNSTFLGLAVDRHRRRLLVAVHAPGAPRLNALAAYDLRSRGRRLFLAALPPSGSAGAAAWGVAAGVAVDSKGSAYVTNSAADLIWKVTADGEASVFSESAAFASRDVPPGLNDIAYVNNGFLLVVQSHTGKMYKVDAGDGTARPVLLNRELPLAYRIAVRRDGVVLVVSMNRNMLWFLKSHDNWQEGVVFDGTALDPDRYASSVAVGRDDRAYVLYGYLVEGKRPIGGRESFEIEEVRSEKESQDEKVWVYVLVGVGLAYFMFWRFQMKQLAQNMNKKHN